MTEKRAPNIYIIGGQLGDRLGDVTDLDPEVSGTGDGKEDTPEDKGGGVGDTIKDTDEGVSDKETVGGLWNMIGSALTKTPIYDEYSNTSLGFNILGILLYLFDYCSDIAVAFWLRKEKSDYFMVCTVLLIVIPLGVVNMFSLVWYSQDHLEHPGGFVPRKKKFGKWRKFGIIGIHILGLGPVAREIQILVLGRREQEHIVRTNIHEGPYCLTNDRSHREYLELYMTRKYYERDYAYLSLIDAFIQDAPQLILQLYILLARHPEDLQYFMTALTQLGSVLLSLVSLSGALVSYNQASRWADPTLTQLSHLGVAAQWMWRMFMLTGRMFVFCIFLTVHINEFFIFAIVHYIIMLLWVLSMRSNFCGSIDGVRRPIAEFIYNLVLAGVLLFDIINITEGATRLKNVFFYLVFGLEQAALVAAWYVVTNRTRAKLDSSTLVPWSHDLRYQVVVLTLVPTCYILGLVFLCLYYRLLHPGGRMPNWSMTPHLI